MKRVRGSQPMVKTVEVNIDTVYIRENIVFIEEDDFKGWEYDEIQYDKNEYLELITNENKLLKNRIEISENVILDMIIGGM